MTTTCNLSKNIVGPFSQTLFLGCSVVDFTSNLGWGADSSTLNVTLVEDSSSHPEGSRLQTNFYNKLKELSKTNDQLFEGDSLKPTNNSDRSTFSKIGKLQNQKFETEDPNKNAHISVIKDIESKEEERKQENEDTKNEQDKDLGKVYYKPRNKKKYWWLDEDPGFLGSNNNAFSHQEILRDKRQTKPPTQVYEILGVPVLFRYGENFNFGGVVTGWTRDVGQEGVIYKVEIKNFSNLLTNTQLIIGHYAGSISNSVSNTQNNYMEKILSSPGLLNGQYNLPPSQGNLPNVINVYGFLEKDSFGNAYETENGIPAYKIYDTLKVLLDNTTPAIASNHWNPYGGLVARSISRDIGTANNLRYETPNPSAITVNSSLSGRLSLEDIGIIPHILAQDQKFRPVFRLDLSEVPRPPAWLRISTSTISLLDFVTQVCDGSGFEFFVDFIPSDNPNFSGTIKIRTVSRRTQPKQDAIDKFIENLESQDVFVASKMYGKEYNDGVSRTMYIGAKQKRLLQCRSHRFTWNQKSFAYDAFAKSGSGSFVNVPNDKKFYNTVRKPESASYRSQNFIKNGVAVFDYQNLPFSELEGPLRESFEVSRRINFINQRPNEGELTSMVHPGVTNFDYQANPIKRGNYQNSLHIESVQPGQITDGTMFTKTSIPIHHDVVSPYFGKHYDGTIRKVYFDPNMGQLQVLFRIEDLMVAGVDLNFQEEISLGVSHFLVLENELRAAGTCFDQWVSYCFDNGFFTDIEKLTYRALFRKYGNNNNFDIGSIHKGFVDSIRRANFPNNFSQISYANASMFSDGLYDTLNAVYKVFNTIVTAHYGKSFMVSVPALKTYRDFAVSDIIIGRDINNQPIYAIEGSGKLYTDYEISPEGAWEEAGNYIDDSIIVGSVNSSALVDDKHMIQPILGFNSSISADARNSTFWTAFLNNTLRVDHPMFLLSQLLKYSAGSQPPNGLYRSLLSSVSPSDFVDVPIRAQTNAVDGAGYNLGFSLHKSYIKSTIKNNFEFLIDAGIAYPKAILELSSPVYLNSTTPACNNLLSNILQDSLLRYTEASNIPIPNRTERKPCLPPEVVKSNGATIAETYVYNLGKFNRQKLANLIGTKTSIGGLSVKIDVDESVVLRTTYPQRVPRIIEAGEFIQVLANAIETRFLLSLGPGLEPLFPFSNPGATASSYNNAQILPKAAIPTFAAVPVQHNQAVYGPWINYPGLIAANIFNNYKKEEAIKRTDNLISGTKLEVQSQLCPWDFGSMAALDKQVMLQTGNDVNYQQYLEKGSIDLPIFPDINLGSFLDNTGPLLTSVQATVGSNGVNTILAFKTYTRKLSLFNKENGDRIKSIALENLKRNREIIAKYNELRDRIKNAEVGSSTSITDVGNLPKMLRWSPSEILVGSNTIVINKTSNIIDIHNEFNYSPSYMAKPSYVGPVTFGETASLKQTSTVTLQDFRECPRELEENYNQKSMMSLDGIISPVSLYPTPHNTTYHFVKYDTRFCPMCKGRKIYQYNYVDQAKMSNRLPGQGSNTLNRTATTKNIICDFCEDKSLPIASILQKDADPPYILTNRSDQAILEEFIQNSVSNISYKTYHPIVLGAGEFSITGGARQNTDKSAHCINAVGYGSIPPNQYGDGLRANASTFMDDAYSDIDRKLSEFSSQLLSNNHRFFGLRGPMVLHSWGYDTDGFPVPNKADQPVMSNGLMVRKKDGTILTLGEDPNDDTVFNREKTFYNGWAQLPGTWPVGPIDFRWDRDKKMWTVGDREKYAFVILEEDLTEEIKPIRGALWDNSSINNKPLPQGFRKLVFVKDNKGITAPRGAKIYCQYSNKNGFYEPIYANAFIASGMINGGNSATIYSAYSKSNLNLSDNPLALSEYNTTFVNPLNFAVSNGSVGIFVYINGSWVLQSQNSCG